MLPIGQPSMPMLNQQQFSNQSNFVQMSNQPGSQQPVIITQAGKKKSDTGQKILNALIILLAVVLVVGVIALTVIKCKDAKEQANTGQSESQDSNKQNSNTTLDINKPRVGEDVKKKDELKTGDYEYSPKETNNEVPDNSLNTVNKANEQSQSV